jgi:hypothetical protein
VRPTTERAIDSIQEDAVVDDNRKGTPPAQAPPRIGRREHGPVDGGVGVRLRHRMLAAALLAAILSVLAVPHWATWQATEPFYNNDETRHVMTSVFFRDALHDRPTDFRGYAESYYVRYPALGLLTFPPFFHVVSGVAMAGFGISMTVPKLIILGFLGLACAYLFYLVRATHNVETATAVTLTMALAPLVFAFSGYVMLEVPALALVLAALFHLHRSIHQGRGRDIAAAALFGALAALTRYDALIVLPVAIVWLAGYRRLDLLRRRQTLAALAASVVLLTPVYGLAAREMASLRLRQATTGIGSQTVPLTERVGYYITHVPDQIGWVATVAALLGLVALVDRNRWRRTWPYVALLVVTFVVISPMAEPDDRHAIYWIPALVVLAAEGALLVARAWPRPFAGALALAAVAIGTAVANGARERPSVLGFQRAAETVLTEPGKDIVILYDGDLNGNFIYQLRRLDPARRARVVRTDRLLYSVLWDARASYEERVSSDAEILDTLAQMRPRFVVVEEPHAYAPNPMAERLRRLLASRPERFTLDAVVPVAKNTTLVNVERLLVFRMNSDSTASRPADPRAGVFVPQLRRRIGSDAGARR